MSTVRQWSDTARGYALNAPAMITILLLVAYPIGYSFWVSLHRDNLAQPAARKLIGLENYLSLVHDPAFLASLRVSALFVLVVVAATVVLGLLLALVLNETFSAAGCCAASCCCRGRCRAWSTG